MIAVASTAFPSSCADPPAATAIPVDIATLSVGLPDGVYFAGKRLTEWLPFKERQELRFDLEARADRDSPEKRARYADLRKRRADESIVVRWEIEGGRTSTPEVLADKQEELEAGERKPIVECAYIWGSAGHTDVYRLWWTLLHEALKALDRESDSINPYVDEMGETAKTFGDEWVLPLKSVCQLIATHDLRVAKGKLERAAEIAQGLDVDVAAVLDATGKKGG